MLSLLPLFKHARPDLGEAREKNSGQTQTLRSRKGTIRWFWEILSLTRFPFCGTTHLLSTRPGVIHVFWMMMHALFSNFFKEHHWSHAGCGISPAHHLYEQSFPVYFTIRRTLTPRPYESIRARLYHSEVFRSKPCWYDQYLVCGPDNNALCDLFSWKWTSSRASTTKPRHPLPVGISCLAGIYILFFQLFMCYDVKYAGKPL